MAPQILAYKAGRYLAVLATWLLSSLGATTGFTQSPTDEQPVTPATLHTQVDQSIQHYAKEIQGDTYESYDISIQPVDPRLRLSRCNAPLDIQHRPRNRNYGRLTMRVECNGDEPWAIHVPVTIQAFAKVVIASGPIAKGTHLSAGDISIETPDLSLLYGGYFSAAEQVNGFVAKRPISAGQVLNSSLMDPVKMINRGEKVVIIAEGPGLNIRTTGVSMEDGAYGELIRVKNANTEKVVEGRISGPGRIKVSL
ncbi:MAG: flagellar basal body P-ring formation chaperone FlgA [Ketobacter sp.]